MLDSYYATRESQLVLDRLYRQNFQRWQHSGYPGNNIPMANQMPVFSTESGLIPVMDFDGQAEGDIRPKSSD